MGSDSLQGLRDLHRDLVALTESRLSNIERLALELETHVEAFRGLLDKKTRNDASRQVVSLGKLKIEDLEYEVNDDFKQATFEIAEALDLDELEAAALLLESQDISVHLDRSPVVTSVIIFHERRQYLLESLRLAFQQANEDSSDNEVSSDLFQNFLDAVTSHNEGAMAKSAYWRKCIEALSGLEKWLHQISERAQSATLVGHSRSTEFSEIIELQRSSLTCQHQTLGAISYHLIRANRVRHEDVSFLIGKIRVFERFDASLIDYLPSLTGLISHFAGSESHCALEEARALHHQLSSPKEHEAWRLRSLHALTMALWLVEYSGRYISSSNDQSMQGVDLDKEAEERNSMFMDSLKDGAFHLMLSFSQGVQSTEWFDPARHAFTTFLLQDGPQFQLDPAPFSPFLRNIVMEQFQIFADSYISNMPDSLRKLKFEEDEQRRQAQSRVQLRASEYDLHLERFLLILAYAYERDPQRSREFWIDPEGNLFGFLQWASQRQSTPRIAAFCEMLRSISEGEECANHAHRFLLEESSTSGKLRKNSPLSWTTIFNELEYYSSNLQDRYNQATATGTVASRTISMQIVEPESSMMLECYLRLVSHLSSESPASRDYILNHQTFKLVQHLFRLCSSNVENRFRACAFTAFNGLLTGKDKVNRDNMWEMLDAWIFNVASQSAPQSGGVRVQNLQLSSQTSRAPTFESLSQGFEQPSSLVGLLSTLVTPLDDDSQLGDSIPFAENLGQAYRMPGIEPYVDFVLGHVFAQKSRELHDPIQLTVLRLNCLTFATTILSTFNENLFVLAEQSLFSVDKAIDTGSLDVYARLHPFGRVMEWFFNDKVIDSLFATLHQNPEDINSAAPDSPLVLSVLRAIEVIQLVLSQQSTYFNVIRPRVKLQSATRQSVVANAAIALFEDVIVGKLDMIPRLGLFCVSGHQDLAISALGLLHKLATSRKLASPFPAPGAHRMEKSRLLTALDRDGAAETISKSFALIFEFDEREIEQGPAAPGFVIKTEILRFLNACLAEIPDHPTIAHLLLGFRCGDQKVEIPSQGLFNIGQSLFHAIVRLGTTCPDGNSSSLELPLVSLVDECIQVVRKLWKSPLTSALVLNELQNLDFIFAQALRQPVLEFSTLWDGRAIDEPEFFLSDSALTFVRFLQQRTAYLELLGSEIRESFRTGMKTLLHRLSATTLGKVILSDGQINPCASVLELLDFSNLIANDSALPLPESQYFSGINFDICKEQSTDPRSPYDIQRVHQLLILRERDIRKERPSMEEVEIQALRADAINIQSGLAQINERNAVTMAFNTTLKCWVQVIMSNLEHGNFDGATRESFTLQVLVLILPRLERALNEDLETAVIFSQLGRSLMMHLQESQKAEMTQASVEDTIADKLFQLFRLSLVGLPVFEKSSLLRETCYQTSLSYLRTLIAQGRMQHARKNALHAIKQIGDHLFEMLCDDAYSAEGNCRDSALLLLESMVTVSNLENSKVIIEHFVRLNFLEVVIATIRSIPAALQSSSVTGISNLLSYYTASLCLLLRVSQTRTGAAEVMNAGFFLALRESGLFSVDPDIGLEIDNSAALTRYFDLVLGLLRVANAIVVSRGPENSQTTGQARSLLRDYRGFVVAIFKRDAKIGGSGHQNERALDALANNFAALISASSYLDGPEENRDQKKARGVFS